MEGITGQVHWKACGAPRGEYYDFGFARRMMTHDVNAAIRGARSAGAEHIVIKDSHGTSRNLLIDELEPHVELISGEPGHDDGMMAGIDDTFDVAILIGYHGMAGSTHGTMEHTISADVHRMYWNDDLVGEIALSVGAAGAYGVPVVAISSDDVGCAEISKLIPGVATATTKVGMGRGMARCFHPSETRPAIESACRDGIQRFGSIAAWIPELPVTVNIEFNETWCADAAERMPGALRVDGYSVSYHAHTVAEAHRATRSLITLAGTGK